MEDGCKATGSSTMERLNGKLRLMIIAQQTLVGAQVAQIMK